MTDRQNRTIDYLRISVTDRCNLRCVYCMPPEGVAPAAHADILTFEELLRIARAAAALGVRKLKLTGGEPLVRKGLTELVRGARAVAGIEQITMTSNGILLGAMARELREAGLDAVNVSVDTLDPARYARITRGGELARALDGIDRALEAGLRVKVNCVPTREQGAAGAAAVAALAETRPVDVRFIELMPIGPGGAQEGIPAREMKNALAAVYGASAVCGEIRGNGPAVYRSFDGLTGKIGFISALSDCFCADCNRLRLTAAGFLKPCLYAGAGTDLRALLRGGASDETLARVIRETAAAKPGAHHFSGGGDARPEQKTMSQIGG